MTVKFQYSLKQLLLGFAAWWILLSFIQTMVLHRLGISWEISVLDSTISNVLLTIMCLSAVIIYRFYQPGAGNRFYRFIYAFGITILYCVILKWGLVQLQPANEKYHEFLEKSIPIRFIFALLILSFVTLLNWMWNIMKEQKEQEQRQNEIEQLAKEAELVRLRQQLQPHFLFNSLNSISALAGTKPAEARKMIQQLSDFLRGTLKKDEQQTTSFREEVEHLKLYLEIEKVRFGHRLNVHIAIEEEPLVAKIPPLLLQPIVENAIKFGLYGTVEAVEVSITAHSDLNYLFVEIKNPFDVQTQGNASGTGFGLSSIQRRLFLLYGRNDLLTTDRKENTFITRLKIPQIKT